MKRFTLAFLVALALLARASGQVGAAQVTSAHLSDFRARPEFYGGKLVQTRCILVDDGFETKWLMESLKILDHPPIPFLLSAGARRDEAGMALLRSVMKSRRMAFVTVQGRLTIHPQSLAPWRSEFVVERVLAASAAQKPNQSLEPTPTAGTSAAEQPLVPAAVVAHL